jgi:hypothetical protein
MVMGFVAMRYGGGMEQNSEAERRLATRVRRSENTGRIVLGFDVGIFGEELVDEAEPVIPRRTMKRSLTILQRSREMVALEQSVRR